MTTREWEKKELEFEATKALRAGDFEGYEAVMRMLEEYQEYQ